MARQRNVTTKVFILPASAAEREASIIFGEPLPALSLNEQATYKNFTYRPYAALADFDGETFGLGSIDDDGSPLKLLGPRIPDTGGTHHWWSATTAPGTGAPGNITLSVYGSPEIHKDFSEEPAVRCDRAAHQRGQG